MLTRTEITQLLEKWNRAWDAHDLDGVMEPFHSDVVFDNWTGGSAAITCVDCHTGFADEKKALKKLGKNHMDAGLECFDCHMPYAAKSAAAVNTYMLGVVKPEAVSLHPTVRSS